MTEAIKMLYIDWSLADYDDTDYFRTFVDYATDFLFVCGNDRVARVHAQAGDPVFRYQMTYAPTESIYKPSFNATWLGAGHGEELQFVFGSPFVPELQYVYPNTPPEEKAFSVQMMRFWTNFARTG